MKLSKLIKTAESPFGAVWTVVLEEDGFEFSRTLWPVACGKPTAWKVKQLLSSISTFHGLEGVLQAIRENPGWVTGD